MGKGEPAYGPAPNNDCPPPFVPHSQSEQSKAIASPRVLACWTKWTTRAATREAVTWLSLLRGSWLDLMMTTAVVVYI